MKLTFSLVLSAVLMTSAAHGMTGDLNRMTKAIQTFLAQKRNRTAPAVGSHVCHLNGDPAQCPLAAMPPGETSLVQAGGATRCIFADSSPYQFQVVPGAPDKLLFYFQGGGACFNEFSTEFTLCSHDAVEMPPVGIFDRSNPNNAFADHTVVIALYCSGDIFGGNVTRPYSKNGGPVIQAGLINTQATLDWVQQQQLLGGLSPVLQQLVVAGDSAGAVGAQLWAANIFDAIPAAHRGVVPDSYVGAFPSDVIPRMIKDFGFCPSLTQDPALQQACVNEQIEIADIVRSQINRYPGVTWQWANSKADSVQVLFFNVIAATEGSAEGQLDGDEFYRRAQHILAGYPAPNAVAFFVDGGAHTFTNEPWYFDTTMLGISGGPPPHLFQWCNNATDPGAERCQHCQGPLQIPIWSHGTGYCDIALAGRCAQ